MWNDCPLDCKVYKMRAHGRRSSTCRSPVCLVCLLQMSTCTGCPSNSVIIWKISSQVRVENFWQLLLWLLCKHSDIVRRRYNNENSSHVYNRPHSFACPMFKILSLHMYSLYTAQDKLQKFAQVCKSEQVKPSEKGNRDLVVAHPRAFSVSGWRKEENISFLGPWIFQ